MNSNNISWFRFTILIPVLFSVSCKDFLEQKVVSGQTEELVFSNISNAEKVLAGALAMPPYDFYNIVGGGEYGSRVNGGTLAMLGDEADMADKTSQADSRYNKGQLTAVNSSDANVAEFKWSLNFQAIRSALLFLDKVDAVKDADPRYIAKRKAEAKVFLASKYLEFLMRFGGLCDVDIYVDQSNIDKMINNPRLSVTQSVNRITSLLDEAIAESSFPNTSTGVDFGRSNKVAAKILKAKTLLWSASPLFNTQLFPGFGVQEIVRHTDITPAVIQQRWNLAKAATLDAINSANAAGFRLVGEDIGGNVNRTAPGALDGSNYRKAVTSFPQSGNTEIVWGTFINGGTFQPLIAKLNHTIYNKLNNTSATPSVLPLQNFVEMYEFTNGSLQNPASYNNTSSTNTAILYSNLDARFHQSIAYNGLKLGSPVVSTIGVSPTGENRPGATINFTGYYCRKFFTDNKITNQEAFDVEFFPYIRLAELYLIYAEVLNESDNSAGLRLEALRYLNKVRNRAGQPNLESLSRWQDSQEYLRKCIKNERAVELAFEGHRYLDLKRWLMGNGDNSSSDVLGRGTIGGNMYMFDLSATGYARTLFESRVFLDKWYFYPLPASDVNATTKLIQNPGW